MSSIFRAIAPIALSLAAPGLGTAIGTALGAGAAAAPIVGNAALGAGFGALGGGGVKGAAVGGLTGGLAGGGGASIAKGLGATGATAQGLGGAIAGGVGGAASGGGLEGALTGAALGGGLNYVTAGGRIPGLGNVAGSTLDQTTGQANMQGPTQGSGALGQLTSASLGGQPVKLGSLLNTAGKLYGYGQSESDLEDLQNMLAAQSAQAQAQFAPYAQAGETALQNMQAPSMEALMADPGYQFRLQQGNQALERSLAARGLGQSGAALKAAQEYGQGLADQTYNDYFARQAQLANRGFGAAQGLGSLYTNLGNVQAAAEIERMNQRNRMLSGLGGLFG